MTNFAAGTFEVPEQGSTVKSYTLRQQLKSAATLAAGITPPSVPAQIVGDYRFSTLNTTTTNKLGLSVNGSSFVVTLPAGTATTIDTIISTINIASTNAGVGTIAYRLQGGSGADFILLRSSISGVSSSITISGTGLGASDAAEAIFGIATRTLTYPGVDYSVSGASYPVGGLHFNTTTETDYRIYANFAGLGAVCYGLKNLSPYPSLGTKRNLRIGIDGTIKDIDITSASNITTLVGLINTAFAATVAYDSGSYLAIKANSSGSSSVIKISEYSTATIGTIFSNSGANPTVIQTTAIHSLTTGQVVTISGSNSSPSIDGTWTVTVLSANTFSIPVAVSVAGSAGVVGRGGWLRDDAIELLFGFPSGEGLERTSLLPYIFRSANRADGWSSNFIRGVTRDGDGGIGKYGPSLTGKINLPSAGSMDGERRPDRQTFVDWIYNERAGKWRRAMPQAKFPLDVDRSNSSYKLRSTHDYYASPGSLTPGTTGKDIDRKFLAAGIAGTGGEVVRLVDAKDSDFPITAYDNPPLGETNRSISRNSEDRPNFDNFVRADTAAGNLGTNLGGVPSVGWTVANSKFHVSANAAVNDDTTGAGTADYAFYRAPIVNSTTALSISGIVALGSVAIATLSTTHGFKPGSTVTIAGVTGTGNFATLTNGTQILTDVGTSTITFILASAPTGIYSSGGTCYIVTSGTRSVDVSAKVYKIGPSPSSQTTQAAEAGLLYCYSTPALAGNGRLVIVRDDGSAGLYTVAAGTQTLVQSFTIDPPLDDTQRTLRVSYDHNLGGGTHLVYWNGSNEPSAWYQDEYSKYTEDTSQYAVSEQRLTAPLAATRTSDNTNGTGLFAGIYAKPAPGDSSATRRRYVAIKDWWYARDLKGPLLGLPPVSGARLRDIIQSVVVAPGTTGYTQDIITDATPEFPLSLYSGTNFKINYTAGTKTLVFNAYGKYVGVQFVDCTVTFSGSANGVVAAARTLDFTDVNYDTNYYSYTSLVIPVGVDFNNANFASTGSGAVQGFGIGAVGSWPDPTVGNNGSGKVRVSWSEVAGFYAKPHRVAVVLIGTRVGATFDHE